EGLYDASRPASPMKSFEHLASGELKDGDVVMLATPGISELIVPQHLRQLLRGNTPEDAAAEIQSRVGRDPAAANSGIVIRYDRRDMPAVQQAPVRPAQRVSSPQPSVRAQQPVTRPRQTPLAPATAPAPARATSPAPTGRPTLLSRLRGSVQNFREQRARAKAAPAPVDPTTAEQSGSAPQASQPAPAGGTSIASRWQRFSKAVKTAWGRLPRRARLFATLAVALIFIFVVSLVAFSNSRQGAASQQDVAAKLQQAKDLEQRVAEAIIFKDFTQAQTLLGQADALVAQVPSSAATKDQVDGLKASLAADREKLTGSVKLGDVKVLASLEGKGTPRGLALVNGKLVVWTDNGSVEVVPTTGGDASASESIKSSLGSPTSGVVDESRAVVLTDKGSLVELDGGKVNELDVTGSFAPSDAAALATYGSRLYVLDQGANRITRHSRTVAGYSAGERWIADGTSVKDGVDLVVDGDLWILRTGGSVTKMTQGSKVDFTLAKPSQPLTNPTRLVTSEGDTFLYVLEPSTKRLLQFDKKSGDFVKQYTADSFGDLTGVVVNEKAHAAYLLSGSQVVQINLQS
ncbi:MAG: hypothetical protein U0514_02885, partial [Candidatus Andersenbacteria bacterium]